MTPKKDARRNDIVPVVPIGGNGTRFYPGSLNTCKHLYDIANHLVLGAALYQRIEEGVRDIVFGATGYENRVQTKAFFGGGARYSRLSPDVKVYFCNYDDREFLKKGSGDVFMWALDEYGEMIDNRHMLLMYGDNLSTQLLDELYQAHCRNDALLTLVVKGFNVSDPRIKQMGTVQFDNHMRITAFAEKSENPLSKYVNTAICLISPKIRDLFKDSKFLRMLDERRDRGRLDVGGHVFPALVNYKAPLYAYVTTGQWADVGTPESFIETTGHILHDEYPHLRYPDHHHVSGSRVHNETYRKLRDRHTNVRFDGHSLVNRQVRLGSNVRIRDSVLGENVVVGDNVSIDDETTLLSFARVDDGAAIKQAIVGKCTIIGRDCVIEPGAFLGDDIELPPNIVIPAGTRVARNRHRKKIEDATSKGKPMYEIVDEYSFDAFGFKERLHL